MNASDFFPEFSAEQIAFITARRYLTMRLFRLLPLVQLKGFSECSSEYRIFGSDGLEIREDNQYRLDGQQVQIGFKFHHREKSYRFNASMTNGENWELIVKMTSGVAPDSIITSGIGGDDLEAAFLKINHALLSALEDIASGRVTKVRTQPLSLVGSPEERQADSRFARPHHASR